jgi:DNA-binding GntR family transcriptional regulator
MPDARFTGSPERDDARRTGPRPQVCTDYPFQQEQARLPSSGAQKKNLPTSDEPPFEFDFENFTIDSRRGQWLTIGHGRFYWQLAKHPAMPKRPPIADGARVIPLAAYRGLLDEVAARIRARIFSGDLRDGERIVERDLAAEMGTSRGPIRDALRILEGEGLVITAPRRGTHVASLTTADALEILAIREALEPVAVNFLLDRNEPKHFEQLQAIVERLDRAALANDWNLAILLDLEFHGTIFELCAQRRILRIWESLKTPMLQLLGKLSHYYTDIAEVPVRHRDLLDSLRSGDRKRALAHSCEHVVAFQEKLLANLPSAQETEVTEGA